MRNRALLFSLAFLAACGGAGSGGSPSTGSTIPVGVVAGTAFDGLILGGTVSVYDFTTGAKGALLGQITSDGNGLYSLSLQVESRPVLVEITGGYYIEEAGAGGTGTQVSLSNGHKLTALANYATGSPLKVAVTTYSHLAAGLAAFEIRQGTAVAAAINDANTRASNLAGVNILTTTPKEITDVSNISATLTPELKYGFLAGAISMWTLNHTPSTAAPRTPPYTSIDFAQLLYQDILADGLLDGIGVDSTGAAAPLSFGATPLGVDVYRKGLGISLVQMAADTNNKTGLTGTQVLPFAQRYVANTDAMFNNVAPDAIVAPVVTITAPAINGWVNQTANVAATIQDTIGITSARLFVDNASAANSNTNLPTQSFQLDTTQYTTGAHTVSIIATDFAGLSTTATIPVGVDNVPPTSTANIPYTWVGNGNYMTVSGCASDVGSGVLSVTLTHDYGVTTVTPNPQTGCWAVTGIYMNNGAGPYVWPVVIRDRANNCSTYSGYNGTAGVWTLHASGPCSN